jgi:hypothetical protein
MNNWGAKHNKVVYLAATKQRNPNAVEFDNGFKIEVTFDPRVTFCKGSPAEKLFRAIDEGLIFLDPAPKFVPSRPSENHRRAQWRVNHINQAVHRLYESVRLVDLEVPSRFQS